MEDAAYICRRKVCLADNGDQAQATEACASLLGIHGIYGAVPVSSSALELSYSVKELSFDLIEDLLKELGYYLDDSMVARLRRNIYQYLEDNLREKLRVDEENQKLACDIEPSTQEPEQGVEPEKYWSNYR